MKASKLIKKLTELQQKYGDLEVFIKTEDETFVTKSVSQIDLNRAGLFLADRYTKVKVNDYYISVK